MRKVEVQTYDPKWLSIFSEEADKIKAIFGDVILRIHHIGSTSVPGLKAKPIIDILPEVKDISVVDQYNQQMIAIGYEPMGEYGITGRRYFRKGIETPTHHVHIFQAGSEESKRHIAFRDYLRTHPADKKKYGDLKQKLAHQFPYNMEAYINGKDALVKNIETKALKWYTDTK